MVAHACHPSYMGSINRIAVQAVLNINEGPYSRSIYSSQATPVASRLQSELLRRLRSGGLWLEASPDK
jgi:hypothetical protein